MDAFNQGALYALFSTLFLLALSIYLYYSQGKPRYLKLWCASWLYFSLHPALDAFPLLPGSWLHLLLEQISQLLSAMLLLGSIRVFRGLNIIKTYHRWYAIPGLMLAVAVTLALRGIPLAETLGSTLAGLTYLWAGYRFYQPGIKGTGEKLLLGALEGMGLLSLGYPWLGYSSDAVAVLYGLLLGLFTVSIVLLIFEEMHQGTKDNLKFMVLSLARAVEARDVYTINHSQQVASIAKSIARRMDLDREEVERIYLAGLLHDIGKIGVPDYILQKPGKLSQQEFEMIRMHAEDGCLILQAAGEIFDPLVPLVRHHHERWDGNGYPDGLKGKQIPLGAAILAVADTFDAIVSNRPYREAQVEAKALAEIKAGSGRQFHPRVARTFLAGANDIIREAENQAFALVAVTSEGNTDSLPPFQQQRQSLATVKVLRPFDYRVRYKGVLDALNDIVLVLSEDLTIIDWNRKAEEVYGYAGRELDGMPVQKLRPPETAPLLSQQMEAARQAGYEVYETRHCKKNGEVFPVEVSLRNFIQLGQTCWLSIVRDISVRQQREDDLLQRETKYRLLFEGVSDGVIVHDLDNKILEANPAVCLRLGYAREELVGMNVKDIDTPESAALLSQRAKALRERGSLIFEVEHQSKTGELIPLEVNVSIIEFAGRPAVLSVQRDLRHRYHLESLAVRMLDALPYAAYLVNSGRRLVAVNRAARSLGALPGQECYRTLRGLSEPCSHCRLQEASQQDGIVKGETTFADRSFLAYWIPLEGDLYLHYFQENA